MKTKTSIILALLTSCFSAWSQGVGINENGSNPNPSAILDIESTNKGLLPPRMTSAQMNAIPNPAIGLIVFCTDCSPASLHQFVGSSWSSLSSNAPQQTISANCTANGFTGSFVAGTTVSNSHFSVTLTNNSFSSASFAVGPSDLVLSGANAGISVSNVSLTPGGTAITTVNIGAGQSVVLYYNLSGSPTSSGTLTGTWAKISLSCSSSTLVTSLSSQVTAGYCSAATVNGFFASTFAMQTTNTFVIAITNNGSTALNLVAPTAANLGLSYSGTASPAFGVGTVSQSTTGALAAGATRTFTYVLTGTPTSIGTLTLNWAYGDLTCTKTKEIDLGAANFASTYCNSGALNGTYSAMTAMTAANTFTVTINNTSGVITPTLPAAVVGNLTLSGPGAAGLTVSAATPAASTLAAGGNRTYTYTLSGTPTGTGALTATWNYMGMTCSKEVTIPALSDNVSANCSAATVNGFFASTFAMQTTNTFVIAITNNGSTALNLVAPTAANLGLSYSGTASPAFGVGTVSQSTTGALASGATRTFTYVLTGTPTSIGTLTLNWAYGDLTCTKTKEIDLGAANFASTYCNSGALNGTYTSMTAMTAANTFTVTINNTSGVITPTLPAAVVGNLTLSGPGAAGLTVSAATPAASTLAAGGSRTYTYTLSGTPTSAATLTATWNYMGMTCSKQINILPQTLSNVCNSSNPTVVIDVTNSVTGKTWMDRNLGANRAAISSTDAQSYGSLYQWGRGSDGHQCVNRYAGDGVTTSGTTTTLSSSNTPGNGNFIVTSVGPNDWRSPQNGSLWQGVNGVNNPCPTGYRLPTETELINEQSSWSSSNASGAYASPLKFPISGGRGFSGNLNNVGENGFYWTSTVGDTFFSRYLLITSSSANMISFSRAGGRSVRCIKN